MARGALLLILLCPAVAAAQDVDSAEPTPAEPSASEATEEAEESGETPESGETDENAAEAPPVEAAPDRVLLARRYFDEGTRLFEAERYEPALAQFRSAFEQLEGHEAQYTVLYNMAQCLERLGRFDEARARYARYLELSGPDSEDRDAVLARIGALGDVVGTLVVTANAPTVHVWENGRSIGRDGESIRLAVGAHGLELRARGHLPARREVDVQAGSLTRLEVMLEPVARGIDPAFFGVGAGLTGAALSVAIGFAVAAQIEHDDALATLAAEGPERFLVDEEVQARRDRFALTADVFFGIAGAFAIASGVLLAFTELGSGGEDDVTISPAAGPGFGGIQVAVRR